jgi:hypothetical protein
MDRFSPGDTFEIPPMQYRLIRGSKGQTDLVLQWRYLGDWQPVTLDHVALIVDAIADNENRLYPYPAKGGALVHSFVRTALKHGWRQAIHDLHLDRARKAERQECWNGQ